MEVVETKFRERNVTSGEELIGDIRSCDSTRSFVLQKGVSENGRWTNNSF